MASTYGIVDASLHVTNGGVNPVLTILALAYRVSRRVAQPWRADGE
jgi:choline dehydrogenase-like flavoprotein